MNCIKCGVEVSTEQMFCDECLAEMEKYPVKPGIAIQLPKRREIPVFKKAAPRRRATPDERVRRLQRLVAVLCVLLLAAVLVIGRLLYPMVQPMVEEEKPKPGQNYSSIESTATHPY